jgi:hypothetical protein
VNLPTPDVSGPAPLPDPALDGSGERGLDGLDGLDPFDAELASALAEIGGRVRPREFDSRAILRRAARGRSCRLLAGSAAVLAVAGGVTASFTRGGGDAAPVAAAVAASGGQRAPVSAVSAGLDPLTVPGVFRTMPGGHTANGFTQFGATGYVAMTGGGTSGYARSVMVSWNAGGVAYSAQVSWFGQQPATALPTYAGTAVSTVNGRTAYLSDIPQRQLTFWTGSQGYATEIIFANGITDASATADELLDVARSLDVTPTAVPMPVQIRQSGLESAEVVSVGVGNAFPSGPTAAWYATMTVETEGRDYLVSVVPGVAASPTPTGTEASTGELVATRTVNGLGITVTTDTDEKGSLDAPTVAQILAHVTALSADPSDWTTNVVVQ